MIRQFLHIRCRICVASLSNQNQLKCDTIFCIGLTYVICSIDKWFYLFVVQLVLASSHGSDWCRGSSPVDLWWYHLRFAVALVMAMGVLLFRQKGVYFVCILVIHS